MIDHAEVEWRRSSYCANGNCVEVAFVGSHVLVRDSKDQDGPVLRLGSGDWKVFLDGVRGRTFDRRPFQGVEGV
jgi:Domain of unknown function (DUF397)